MLNSSLAARYAALALVAFALAGCNKEPVEAPATETTPAAAATAPAVAANPNEINEPIAEADAGYTLALVGAPTYEAQDDMLVFTVEVSNTGKRAIVSGGKFPVRLGITLAGPDGVDVAPGKRDFQRAMLPLIAPGANGQTEARVPAEPLLGLTVRGEIVQEGVAWYGASYKQPTLDIGTFQRCKGAAGTLCDATGKPVAAMQPAAPKQ